MPQKRLYVSAAFLLAAAAGCQSGRYSNGGLALPADGDPERGRASFIALECYKCHQVADARLPQAEVAPELVLPLGGVVDRRLSDAYLVTSMINPNHELAPYPKSLVTTGGISRMPPYADRMTARQIVDIVAFLQANYRVRNPEYTP